MNDKHKLITVANDLAYRLSLLYKQCKDAGTVKIRQNYQVGQHFSQICRLNYSEKTQYRGKTFTYHKQNFHGGCHIEKDQLYFTTHKSSAVRNVAFKQDRDHLLYTLLYTLLWCAEMKQIVDVETLFTNSRLMVGLITSRCYV